MGLVVIIVLLLVVMPVLLYLMGAGIKRYTEKPPSWIGFPTAPKAPSDKPDGDAARKVRR